MKKPAPMTGTIIPAPGRVTTMCHIYAHIVAREDNFASELLPDQYREAARRLKLITDPIKGKDAELCYEPAEWLDITFPNMEHRPDMRIVEWCYILDIMIHDAAVAYLRFATCGNNSQKANDYSVTAYELFMISAELRKSTALDMFRKSVEKTLKDW